MDVLQGCIESLEKNVFLSFGNNPQGIWREKIIICPFYLISLISQTTEEKNHHSCFIELLNSKVRCCFWRYLNTFEINSIYIFTENKDL